MHPLNNNMTGFLFPENEYKIKQYHSFMISNCCIIVFVTQEKKSKSSWVNNWKKNTKFSTYLLFPLWSVFYSKPTMAKSLEKNLILHDIISFITGHKSQELLLIYESWRTNIVYHVLNLPLYYSLNSPIYKKCFK